MRRVMCALAAFALILSCCPMLRAQAVPASAAPRSALAALAIRLPEVKFDGTRFADAIDYLREASGANFFVDWKALESVGVTRDTPVSYSARRITLRKALSLILSQTANPGELAFYNDGGVIEVTTKAIADDVVITRVYDVEDLLILPMSMNNNNGTNGTSTGNGINSSYSSGSSRSGGTNSGRSGYSGGTTSSRSGGGSLFGGGTSGGAYGGRSSSYSNTSGTTGNGYGNGTDTQALADQLITIIMDTIEPNIWRENGGTSTIRYFRGNLIITAPRRIHERIGGAFE